MPSVKKVMTPAMESCLSKIVSMSAIDDTKKDRKIRKKICKSYNVDFHEFEDRYNKFKSKGGLVTCPATRPSSSSEKDKRRRSGSRTGEKNASDTKLKRHGQSSSQRSNSTPPSSAGKTSSKHKKKKRKGSIDDIFSGLSDKKKKRKRDEEKLLLKEKSAKLKKKKMRDERCKMVPLRIDEDTGFNVYSEESLNLNRVSGGTPLCPFDCDCCF